MKFYNYIKYFFLIIIPCTQLMQAQVAVTNFPPMDNEEYLVNEVFLGGGITTSNYSSVGFENGIGYFDGFNANIGFEEGIILSTGGLELVTEGFGVGSGVSGDSDLELALNQINLTWNVNNVTILEFDFVAESESVEFNYVFSSTEYTSFTCSSYNDIFGFFLSGPGITGIYSNNAVNIALVPDPNNPGSFTTTPVAVNTINAGELTNDPDCENIDPNFESYNVFWVDNDYIGNDWQGVNQPPSPEFTVEGVTGFTVPLVAQYDGLICGETYHIKLAIADASDTALNSAVFLEANSFTSPDVQISTVPNTELGLVLDVENGVLEGCGEAAIQFVRGGDMSMDLTVDLSYSGTAEYGVDYNELPTQLILPAFENQVIMPIEVFFDNLNELQENLIITVSGIPIPCQEEGTEQDIELVILDQDDLLVDVPDEIIIECLGSADIGASITGGYPPYNFIWYDIEGNIIEEGQLFEQGEIIITQSPESTTTYSLSVSDDCLDQQIVSLIDVVVEDESLSVSLDDFIEVCDEDLVNVTINPNVIGGLEPYIYAWFYNGVLISNDEVLSSLPGEGLYQFIAEEACGVIVGDEITVSVVTPSPYVELISNDVLDPALLPEGCFESILQFNVPEIQDEDINLNFSVEGTAELGIDYIIESTSIVIPAGEETFFVPISVIEDDIQEGVESIEFNFPFIDICSDWPTEIIVQIYEPPSINVEVDEQVVLCLDEIENGFLEGFVNNGGIGLVNYGWYYQGNLISNEMDLPTNGLETGIYSFTAIDQCDNIATGDVNFDIDPGAFVLLTSNDVEDPSFLPEGCFESILEFNLPQVQSEDVSLDFSIGGSADLGLDYIIETNSIIIPAGDQSFSLPISIIVDDFQEGDETIEFSFPFVGSCSEGPSAIGITIFEPNSIYIELDEYLVLCQDDVDSGVIEASTGGGIDNVVYGWYYEGDLISTDIDLPTFNLNEGIYTFTVVDECGNTESADINFSIIEPSPYVELTSNDVEDPSFLPEGCFESILEFNLPQVQSEDVNLDFSVGGSADLGVDYFIENTFVTIPAGEQLVSLPILIFVDDIEEGNETINFNFPFINTCSDWPTDISVDIYEPNPIYVDVDDGLVLCQADADSGILQAFTADGIGDITYGWYYEGDLISTDFDLSTNNLSEGVYTFMAVDECDNTASANIDFEIIEYTPTVSLSSLDYENPSILSEGCGYSTMTFDLPIAYSENTVFNLLVSGSSNFINGQDVELVNSFVEFPAGVTSVDVDILPILDDLNEDIETISFSFPFSNDCVPQSDIELSILNYTPVSINLPSPEDLCAGQSLDLLAEYTGGFPPYELTWNYLGEVEESELISIEVIGGESLATFTIVDGCGRVTTEVLDLQAVDAGVLRVVWPGTEAFACVGDNSEINLVVQGGFPPYTYDWYLDGIPIGPTFYDPIEDDAEIFPDEDQLVQTMPPYTPYVYNYQVFITDSCSNQLEYNIEVTVDDCILPTSFTPNGDGNNDVFWLSIGDIVGKVGIEIFNRWGSVVYQSEDYSSCVNFQSDCWDGTHFENFGDMCNTGVYYYVLTYSRPINNMDSYDVSSFEETVAGDRHNRNMGLSRSGNILLLR